MIKTIVKLSKLVFCTYLSHFSTVLDDFFSGQPVRSSTLSLRVRVRVSFSHPGDDPCHCLAALKFKKPSRHGEDSAVASSSTTIGHMNARAVLIDDSDDYDGSQADISDHDGSANGLRNDPDAIA